MRDMTNNEMRLMILIFKSPEKEYSASSLAQKLGITSMGALKIARTLEKEDVLKSKQIGNSKIYKINLKNGYAADYLRFLLKREAEQAPAYVKMWINELRKIRSAEIAILFGSASRDRDANDVDVLFITDQKKFSSLKTEVEKINAINIKRLHPLYQTRKDIKTNIKVLDKALLNALKGTVAFGEDKLISLIGE